MLQRQSLALFVAWNTRSRNTAFLERTICNVFLHIEKGFIGIRGVRIYKVMHFPGGLRSWYDDTNKLKVFSRSEFAYFDTSSEGIIYSIAD